MESLDAFLIALAIILIIIVVYQNRKFFDKSQDATTAHVAEHWVNCNDPANNLKYWCSQQFDMF